jgi:hypothetical protein
MAIPNIVFYDTETKFVSSDFPDGWGLSIPDWRNPAKELSTTSILRMEFGVAATYDNKNIKLWHDPTELLIYLLSPGVDAIVSFNGERFDFPMQIASIDPESFDFAKMEFSDSFKEVYLQLASKSIDILSHVERVLGHRISLAQIVIALEDSPKIADGTQFWKLFNSPEPVERVLATNYVLDDVIRLQKIYAIAHEFGMLAFRDNLGTTRKFEIKLPSILDLKK